MFSDALALVLGKGNRFLDVAASWGCRGKGGWLLLVSQLCISWCEAVFRVVCFTGFEVWEATDLNS